jgi:hypothetical protein
MTTTNAATTFEEEVLQQGKINATTRRKPKE